MISSILAMHNPVEHVTDKLIVPVGGYWLLSNHTIMLLTTGVIMLLVFPRITKPYREGKLVPTGSRNMIEALLLFVRDGIAKPVLGDDTARFIPFLWTLFFFVLINNLLGLIPFEAIQNLIFVQGMGKHDFHAIGGTSTSNFFVTATLALISFVVIQYNGIKANGIGGWAHHFLGGAPIWLAPLMIIVEGMGMLIKPIALAIRLAANMTAGHLLLAVLIAFVPMAWEAMGTGGGIAIGIISVLAATAIMVLELFVACLQAYLFTFLTALFISQLIVHHHDDEHHKEHEGDEFGESHADREHDAVTHDTAVKPAH